MNELSQKQDRKHKKPNFKIGEVLFYRHEWRLGFKCNICHEEITHMKKFITHSLEHLYDINEEAVNCLLDGTSDETITDIHPDLNEVPEYATEKSFVNENHEDKIFYNEDVSLENTEDIETLEDDTCTDNSVVCDEEETNTPFNDVESNESRVGETILTDLVAEEFLAEDGSGFEREFLKTQPFNPQHLKSKENTNVTSKNESHNAKYHCNRCNKSFIRKESLKNHIKRHTAVHPCDMCNVVFNDHGNLRVHRYRHLGIQPHSCEICEKRFTTTTELKLHMRTHTGEKPFVCEECGMSFVSSSGYHIHKRRTHRKLRPLKCDMCERRFLTRMELEDHLRLHKSEKTLKCPECGEGFKTNRTLLRHKKKHFTVLEYKCQFCNQKYDHNIGLYWHIKREHSQITT